MTWVSLHVFHHGDLDALLVDGVRPLVGELHRRSLIDGFFFLRYWEGGPHVRIRLSSTAGDRVRDLATDRLRAHLAAHPSQAPTGTGDYGELAARLAAREGMTAYLREPMPNDTVHEIAYRPETGRYGDGASLARAERHFVESSRIALGLIAAGTTRAQRQTVAFSALLLARHGRRLPAPARHDAYEPHYLRTRDVLHDLARRTDEVAAGTSPLPADGALTAWWRTVRTLPDPRVADLCAHLFCNRLGIGPDDERCLRYLAARTTSENEAR